AVYGTVNDLAMCGAKPLYLSAGFIIEEGLKTETLSRIVNSMSCAAKIASVAIVTGDTKVVDRGKGDGIFINTAGIGIIEHRLDIAPRSIKPGDRILLSGDLGRHGTAIMAVREGLAFESRIESDSASVSEIVEKLLKAGIQIHCLRDLTRGGLSSALNEIAQSRGLGINIVETTVPVRPEVASACEIFGLDPFYVANEGRFIAFVPQADAERALALMRSLPLGRESALIGEVGTNASGMVTLKNEIGTGRILDMLTGDQLPRIC
ncbi:MAG: hydrogenase expression/formation protein HypE, partial [Candidatus Omnitrophica bacterium CG07_land_8_20_14_0_80_50_8]